MRKLLRILALVLVVGAVAFWLATGASRGWSSNQKTVRTLDEITQIEGITYEDKFTPGVDFLGATFLGAGILIGLSFLFRAKPNQQPTMKTQLITILSLALAGSALAAPQTFDFKDPKGVNNVIFHLDAPLEAINGSANGISGTVKFDPAKPADTTGRIVVTSESLTVPNSVMKGHLHSETWMDTAKFPEIVFEVKELKKVKAEGNVTTADAVGSFTLHGVTKELTVPVKLTYLKDKLGARMPKMEGDLLVVRANFVIKRADFNINPKAPDDKVSDEINLTLSLAGASPK